MDIRQLRYFIRISELGSFARASEQLNVAQTALGYQIRNLEEELDVKLFDRHSRGIELTEAGTVLLERSIRLVRDFDEARRTLRELRDPLNGRLSVGLAPTASHCLAFGLIQECARQHPNLKLSLMDGPSRSLLDLLLEEKIDVCCVYDVPDDPRFERMLLIEEELCLIERSDGNGTGDDTIRFEELEGVGLVLPSMPHNLRALVEQAARRAQIPLDVVVEVQALTVTSDLVKAGVGATILPSFAVRGAMNDAGFRIRRIVAPALTRPLWFVSSGRRNLTTSEAAVLAIVRTIIDGVSRSSPMAG